MVYLFSTVVTADIIVKTLIIQRLSATLSNKVLTARKLSPTPSQVPLPASYSETLTERTQDHVSAAFTSVTQATMDDDDEAILRGRNIGTTLTVPSWDVLDHEQDFLVEAGNLLVEDEYPNQFEEHIHP